MIIVGNCNTSSDFPLHKQCTIIKCTEPKKWDDQKRYILVTKTNEQLPIKYSLEELFQNFHGVNFYPHDGLIGREEMRWRWINERDIEYIDSKGKCCMIDYRYSDLKLCKRTL